MAKKMSLHKLHLIYNKTQGHCAYCGQQLTSSEDWQVDHMIPKAQDGNSSIENLVAACIQCNQSKGIKTPSEYKERMTYGYAQTIDRMIDTLIRFSVYDKTLAPVIQQLKEMSQTLRDTKIFFYMDAVKGDWS